MSSDHWSKFKQQNDIVTLNVHDIVSHIPVKVHDACDNILLLY